MSIAERKEREKELRREQIIEAAKQVFYKKGFSASTIEEIASAAQLSPGTLYLYFKNKDDLYVSIMLNISKAFLDKLEALYNRSDLNPFQKLQSLKEVVYSIYELDPVALRNVFALQTSEGIKNLSEEISEQIILISKNIIRTISKIFEDGIREKLFIEKHPIALADITWSVFSGLVIWEESKRVFDPRKKYLKETIDLAIDIISHGVKAQAE